MKKIKKSQTNSEKIVFFTLTTSDHQKIIFFLDKPMKQFFNSGFATFFFQKNQRFFEKKFVGEAFTEV